MAKLVLYRDNRIDGRYEITPREIANGFLQSEWSLAVLGGMLIDRALGYYLCDGRGLGQGLSSTFDLTEADNRAAYNEARELIVREAWATP